MRKTFQCLREKLVNQRTHDQLITLFSYFRRINPGKTTYSVEEVRSFYKRVDLQPPSPQDIDRTIRAQGFSKGHEQGTFGVEQWLIDKYREINEPCLKTSLRLRFMDAYEANVGALQRRFPLITRILIIGGVIYGIVQFALDVLELMTRLASLVPTS